MQDQKERLLNENRLQMNDMFGSGKKEMYNSNVREGIQNVDAQRAIGGINSKSARESKQCVINDTVYKSYDLIEKEQDKKNAKQN